MKRIKILWILTTAVTACLPAQTSGPPNTLVVPSVTSAPVIVSTPTEAVIRPKLPAPSFESETYFNEQFGFALDYPVGWTVKESIMDDRTQIQFLSSPEIQDGAVVPEGTSRVIAVIYDWEPRDDLPAFIANWKTNWNSSGFTMVEEQPLVLELGLNAVLFTLKTPTSSAVVLVTALADRYMVLSGEGDLELVKEIVLRLRPVSG